MTGSRSYCEVVLPRSWWGRAAWRCKQRIRSAAVPCGDGRDYTGWSARFLGDGLPDDPSAGVDGPVVAVRRERRRTTHEIDLGDHGRHYACLPSPEWELIAPDGRVYRLGPWSREGIKYRVLAW